MFQSFQSITAAASRAVGISSARAAQFLPAQRHMMLSSVNCRGIATQTFPTLMSLDEFRDPVPRQKRMQELVGRSWSVKELRRKNYDDLQKLWIVLYKERNMLLTERQIGRRRSIIFPQPERFQKVQKSMGAIRHVLGERKRSIIGSHLDKKRLEELEAQEAMNEDDWDDDEEEAEEAELEKKHG